MISVSFLGLIFIGTLKSIYNVSVWFAKWGNDNNFYVKYWSNVNLLVNKGCWGTVVFQLRGSLRCVAIAELGLLVGTPSSSTSITSSLSTISSFSSCSCSSSSCYCSSSHPFLLLSLVLLFLLHILLIHLHLLLLLLISPLSFLLIPLVPTPLTLMQVVVIVDIIIIITFITGKNNSVKKCCVDIWYIGPIFHRNIVHIICHSYCSFHYYLTKSCGRVFW